MQNQEIENQIEVLLIANGIPVCKKAPPPGEQEALERYKEVLDLLAEIIADDFFKRRKGSG